MFSNEVFYSLSKFQKGSLILAQFPFKQEITESSLLVFCHCPLILIQSVAFIGVSKAILDTFLKYS